jgi:hypothetical protein
MHGLRFVCLLAIGLLANGAAFAQSAQRPRGSTAASPLAGKSTEEIRRINERVADWHKTCLEDWDQATHMSKQDWKITCQRVATERGKFLLSEPGSMSVGTRRRQQ